MSWFKLHDEFLTDPKMLRYFTKAERCDWIGVLCLANKSRERGAILLPDDEIAYALDLSDAKWGTFADKLIQRRMIDRRDDGAYIVLQWEDRQHGKPSDSPEATAERKRQQREREKLARDIEEKEDATTSHAPVTRDSVTCHAEEEENKTRQEETRREEIYTHNQENTPTLEQGKPARNGQGFDFNTWFDSVFWPAYPRKVGKEKAKDGLRRSVRTEAQAVEVMAGLCRYRESEDWAKENGKFIPHGSTWVTGKRWQDTPRAVAVSPDFMADRMAGKPFQDPVAAFVAAGGLKRVRH